MDKQIIQSHANLGSLDDVGNSLRSDSSFNEFGIVSRPRECGDIPSPSWRFLFFPRLFTLVCSAGTTSSLNRLYTGSSSSCQEAKCVDWVTIRKDMNVRGRVFGDFEGRKGSAALNWIASGTNIGHRHPSGTDVSVSRPTGSRP